MLPTCITDLFIATPTRERTASRYAYPTSRWNDPTMSDPPRRVWKRSLYVLVAIGCLVSITVTAQSEEDVRRPSIVVAAVRRARPAVVNIHGQKTVSRDYERGELDGTRKVNGMGTGVIIDPRGYVITNHHVVEGVRRIQVSLSDGCETVARLVAHDLSTDLAILKISSDSQLPVITIGSSSELEPGETVIAMGNAYGYEHTVTKGIISALHRSVQVSKGQSYDNLIQTDASINPGNSGGPLLNVDGEMIGINVAVRVGAQGIGFALPVDEVMKISARLLSVRRLENRWHGVTGETVVVADRKSEYVVTSISRQSPADRSGLRSGDVITKVGSVNVHRTLDFERAFIGHGLDDEIKVVVIREDEPMKLSMRLDAAPRSFNEPIINQRSWQLFGMKFEKVLPSRVRRLNDRYRGGLKVTSVRGTSPAGAQGIRAGDILVGMHVWETISLENLAYIMNRNDIADIQPIKFYVLRGNETLYGHLPLNVATKSKTGTYSR